MLMRLHYLNSYLSRVRLGRPAVICLAYSFGLVERGEMGASVARLFPIMTALDWPSDAAT